MAMPEKARCFLSHPYVKLVRLYAPVWLQCSAGGGTSSAGLPTKKLSGFKEKPTVSTGITGQSSERGT